MVTPPSRFVEHRTQPLVAAMHLGRRRPNGSGWLLNDVGITIKSGERLGLVGPTGAGKTLLLRALAMLDPVDSGHLTWRGQDVGPSLATAFRSHVIYLQQRPALTAGSVEENLQLPFTLDAHKGKRFDKDRTVGLLEELGRDRDFLKRDISDLSGGERQIVALLRAIQLDPSVLLLDEPTAAMDAKSSTVVKKWVAAWVSASPAARALLWVSHDDKQIARVTTRVVEIHQGRLAASAAE